ncbi:MAG: GAF domain-containing protein [Nitrospinota bacterium]|nr:MAG: GAF domain-containing protein [Nitrospinota bacterium]
MKSHHRYYYWSTLWFFLLAFALSLTIPRLLEKGLLNEAQETTVKYVAGEIQQLMTPADFTFPLSPELEKRLERFFRRSLTLFRYFIRLKLYDASGRILWSDMPALIGKTFPEDKDLWEALSGKPQAVVTAPQKEEHQFERAFPYLMEIYVPIRYPHTPGVVGVVEVYQSIGHLYSLLFRIKLALWGGFFLLYSAVIGTAYLTSRKIVSQNRALQQSQQEQAELNRRLSQKIAALSTLQQVSTTMAEDLSLERALHSVVHYTAMLSGGARVALLLFDETRRTLRLMARLGFPQSSLLPEVTYPSSTLQERLEGRHPWQTSPQDTTQPLLPWDHHPSLYLPLVAKGKVIGLLWSTRLDQEFSLTPDDRQLLETFAHHAALIIENAYLHETTLLHAQRLAVLNDLSQKITTSLVPEKVIQEVLAAIQVLIPESAVHFWERIEEEEELRLVASAGFSTPREGFQTRFAFGKGVVGIAAETRQPVVCSDVTQDPRFINKAWAREEGLVSCITLPLFSGERYYGNLTIFTRTPYTFTEDEVKLLQTFAGQVAIALENARLFAQATQSKEEWEQTFNAIGDWVLILDNDYVIRKANAAVAQQTGFSPQEIEGKQCYELFQVFCPCPECFQERPCRQETPSVREVQCESKTFQIASYPLHLNQGEQIGSVQVVRDVTHLKTLEAQVIQAEKLSALGEIVASVAHELNNPLTTVVGYSQLLLASASLESREQERLQRVTEEALRASQLVQRLLAFARRQEPVKRPVNLNTLVQKVLALREYQLRVDNISVQLALDPSLPPVLADAQQLEQVYLNIINNAAQAMHEQSGGGTLTIRSWHDAEGVHLSFADTGPGIPPEYRDRIFEPFFTTKPVGKGTGLGLSVSYGIMKAHQGTIRVESEVGKGATFYLSLPLPEEIPEEEEEEEAQVTPSPSYPDSLATKRVLVVDDEEGIREFISEVLEEAGCTVHGAGSGREALEKLEQASYDLIISDIKMPDLGGKELYEMLQQSASPPELRFLFITGDTYNPATEEFLRASGCQALAKPFTVQQLLTTVQEMLAA